MGDLARIGLVIDAPCPNRAALDNARHFVGSGVVIEKSRGCSGEERPMNLPDGVGYRLSETQAENL
jgi:hypothetical protein